MTLVVVVFGVAIVILFNVRRVKEGSAYAVRKAAPVRSRVMRVPKAVRDVLQKYFVYYNNLPEALKPQFERRVCTFMYSKRFIPRNVDGVPLEGRVLIAASAVQLTMGLPNVYLQHFDKILVYPNDYYSAIKRRYHRGEVNPRFGIIVLSWQSFVDGYIYPTDSINLGLHEMAHALLLENIIRQEDYKFFDPELLGTFDAYAREICRENKQSPTPFFRVYACTNEHEFFAVAVENFFERPQQFKEVEPELYDVLSKLLNQDPLCGTITPLPSAA